jgi:hypothetical protein
VEPSRRGPLTKNQGGIFNFLHYSEFQINIQGPWLSKGLDLPAACFYKSDKYTFLYAVFDEANSNISVDFIKRMG